MFIYCIGMKKSQKRNKNQKRKTVKQRKGGMSMTKLFKFFSREPEPLTEEEIEILLTEEKALYFLCYLIFNHQDNKDKIKAINSALFIIKHKTDIEYYKNQKDDHLSTALILACILKDKRIANSMIDRLLDIKQQNKDLELEVKGIFTQKEENGRNALMYAIHYGSDNNLVERLINTGYFNPEDVTNNGQSALLLAYAKYKKQQEQQSYFFKNKNALKNLSSIIKAIDDSHKKNNGLTTQGEMDKVKAICENEKNNKELKDELFKSKSVKLRSFCKRNMGHVAYTQANPTVAYATVNTPRVNRSSETALPYATYVVPDEVPFVPPEFPHITHRENPEDRLTKLI